MCVKRPITESRIAECFKCRWWHPNHIAIWFNKKICRPIIVDIMCDAIVQCNIRLPDFMLCQTNSKFEKKNAIKIQNISSLYCILPAQIPIERFIPLEFFVIPFLKKKSELVKNMINIKVEFI